MSFDIVAVIAGLVAGLVGLVTGFLARSRSEMTLSLKIGDSERVILPKDISSEDLKKLLHVFDQ